MNSATKHGGARKGSGRNLLGGNIVSVRLDDATVDLAKEAGVGIFSAGTRLVFGFAAANRDEFMKYVARQRGK